MRMPPPAEMSREELLVELQRLTDVLHQQARLTQEMHAYEEQVRDQERALHGVRDELESQRDWYGELFDFAPVPYLILDAYGVIRALNLTAPSPGRMACTGSPSAGSVPPTTFAAVTTPASPIT